MGEWKPGAKELQTRSLPRRWAEDRVVEPGNRTRPSMGEVAAGLEGRLIKASDLKKAAGLEDTAGFKVGAEAIPVDVPAFGVPIGTRPTMSGLGPGVKELGRAAEIVVEEGCKEPATGAAGKRKSSATTGSRKRRLGSKSLSTSGSVTSAPLDLPGGSGQVGAEPKKGGRPKTVGEPWKTLDPPISKAEYYRRKKGGVV